MLRFQGAMRRMTATPLDRRRLEHLARVYGSWAEVVGGQWRARNLRDKLALCAKYDDGIRSSYTVRTGGAEYGKDMWVAWTLRNETQRAVVVTQGGILWARGVFPADRIEWDPEREAWSYTWGASSADPVSLVRPGKQVTVRASIGRLGYLPMRSDGTIVGVRPGLYVAPLGRSYSTCAVPVRRSVP